MGMGKTLDQDETVEPARLDRRSRWPWLPLVAITLVATTGCAVHYRSARSGAEHLWGLGTMTWKVDASTNGHQVVTSGVRLPGLAVGVGTDFWGLSLGYTVRERMAVVGPEENPRLQAPEILGPAFHKDSTGVFGFGHLHLTGPTGHHLAVVTGRAIAGLQFAMDDAGPALHVGTARTQITELSATNLFVAIDQDSDTWPYFDFANSRVEIDDGSNQDEPSTPSLP
jgi:hypothetical protein